MQDKMEQQTKAKAMCNASNVQVTIKKDIYERVKEVLKK